jgi:hypothetical protein
MGSFSKNVSRTVLPLSLAVAVVACVAEPPEEARAGAVPQADTPASSSSASSGAPQCSSDGGSVSYPITGAWPGYGYPQGYVGAWPSDLGGYGLGYAGGGYPGGYVGFGYPGAYFGGLGYQAGFGLGYPTGFGPGYPGGFGLGYLGWDGYLGPAWPPGGVYRGPMPPPPNPDGGC